MLSHTCHGIVCKGVNYRARGSVLVRNVLVGAYLGQSGIKLPILGILHSQPLLTPGRSCSLLL